MRGRTKTLAIAMTLLIVSGCSFGQEKKNPVLENPAFDIIGDQGIKDDATLAKLQGEYFGKLWFEAHENNLTSSKTFDCAGRIDGSALTLAWTMEDKSYEPKIEFNLREGILQSFESPQPTLIAAVKVYPSGLMVDGLFILKIDDGKTETEAKVHFQLVK